MKKLLSKLLPGLALCLTAGLMTQATHAATTTTSATQAANSAAPSSCPATLQHTFPRLQDEKPQSLCQYAGKVVLVLGFPSNDFSQETGDNKQIADFCENTFGVKFPMFAKSSVTGAEASPFFKQLAELSGQKPRWNFYKYLLGRDGRVVASYSSMSGPDDKALLKALQHELQAR